METTTLRSATMSDLVAMLRDQQGRKLDAVVPATKITAQPDGTIRVEGVEAMLTDDGVDAVDGIYRPTDVMHGHLAEKLGIPGPYLKRLRSERPDLWTANINGWLQGHPAPEHSGESWPVEHDADPRSFLLRTFRPDVEGGGTGIGRAMLSDRYGIIDNLDMLTASLDGIRAAGAEVQIGQCDLTDRRMYVKVHAPGISALAPALLDGYRSPFTGERGADNPTVFAGVVLANSEVGDGSMTITPQITVQICNNGMTMTRDALRKVHLGGRMDQGIRASVETERAQLELIRQQAADAMRTFLDVEYVERKIAELAEAAGVKVERPEKVIEHVAIKLGYTRAQQDDVLAMFIEGGDLTAGGVMHAVTAAAHRQADADMAHAMEAHAVSALTEAAAAA